MKITNLFSRYFASPMKKSKSLSKISQKSNLSENIPNEYFFLNAIV